MKITTVKLQTNGYLVNGNINVPNSAGNRNYQEVQEWLETNTADPIYDLDETRANKLKELEKQYNNAIVRTVVYNTKKVIVNEDSLNGIQSKITLIENNTVTSVNWYFDDGNTSSLALSDLQELQILIANKDQLLRDIKHEHQQAIEALTDVTSIDAYDVTGDSQNYSWGL